MEYFVKHKKKTHTELIIFEGGSIGSNSMVTPFYML